jgi:hypothetical protein
MLDGLQLDEKLRVENETLFDLVRLQERRIVVLKDKVRELEKERDILLSELCKKDEDPSSDFCGK